MSGPIHGRLFVFSGIDGAGKSTQIKRVASSVGKSGRPPCVMWARGGYTTGMNSLKRVLRRNSRIPAPGPSAGRSRAFAKPWLRKCWLGLAILDLIRVYGVVLRWRLWRGQTVLCDRYWPDTLLDFQLHFPEENVARWFLWRALQYVCPRPTASFLLLVPLSVSLQRSQQKQEPFPTPVDVLANRLEAYRQWSSEDSYRLLDGQRPLDDLTNEIMSVIAAPVETGRGSQPDLTCTS